MTTAKIILVVDDSAFARNTTIVCLRGAGLGDHEFVEMENGREAFDFLKKQEVDLVITDLNMPVMDGTGLLRRVRANPILNQLPVVVVSSVVGPIMQQELSDMGANAVLRKPLSGPVATETIHPLLEECA